MLFSSSVENVLTQVIQEKFAAIEPLLNERTRRRWAAVEARALGRGGIARVAEATGLSRATIGAGLRELAEGPEDDDAGGRLRGPGAGRKALAVHDSGLVAALETLVDPATRGDPTGPFRAALLQVLEHLRRLAVPEGLFHDVPAHRITRLRRQGIRDSNAK